MRAIDQLDRLLDIGAIQRVVRPLMAGKEAEVFLVVHRKLPEFDGRAPARSWVFGILRRVLADRRRRHGRKEGKHRSIEAGLDRDLTAQELDPAALAELSGQVSTTAPLKPGETLYTADSEATHWHFVRSGVFKTICLAPDGEEHVTGFHYPGEVLGLSPGEGDSLDDWGHG